MSGPVADTNVKSADGHRSCIACGGVARSCDLPGLLRCPNCTFVTADVSLSESELARLYGPDYFHGSEYRDYAAEARSLRLNFARRLRELERIDVRLAGAEVLEIGCAYGYFLDEISGLARSAIGIDVSADGVTAAKSRGHDAICANYLDVRFDRAFDFIAMWDTIEHLGRPDLFLRKAATDLREGGHIAITTGDIGSWNARLRGRRWRMIHPPTHLHYFSVASITQMLASSGFSVVHVSHPGNARELRSILHFVLDLRLGWHHLYRSLADLKLMAWALTLNLHDIMFVVARRTGGGVA